MKYVRFYEEYKNKRKGLPAGNVFALFDNGTTQLEGLGAIFEWPNSPVAATGVSWKFLRKNCKRISEARARKIHPRLFARLDET